MARTGTQENKDPIPRQPKHGKRQPREPVPKGLSDTTQRQEARSGRPGVREPLPDSYLPRASEQLEAVCHGRSGKQSNGDALRDKDVPTGGLRQASTLQASIRDLGIESLACFGTIKEGVAGGSTNVITLAWTSSISQRTPISTSTASGKHPFCGFTSTSSESRSARTTC